MTRDFSAPSPPDAPMPNIRQLADAARAGDLETARVLLAARPDLINLCVAEDDEHRALHHAVMGQHVEMVRLLMQHGADSRLGIWPHRDATRPRVMARERGYTDILAIMNEEEVRRAPALAVAARSPDIIRAFQQGDESALIAALGAHPALIHASDDEGRTALHWSAIRLWRKLAAWLLDHGADVRSRTRSGDTPMDMLGDNPDAADAEQPQLITALASLFLERGAEHSARSAIVANDAAWLRARRARGALADARGLVTHAVRADRIEMLRLLLEMGSDPDEAGHVDGLDEVVVTFGEPLRACASSSQISMAECLLQHGANPNTQVYAASSALFNAHQRRDAPMIALLERHGARLDACAVGLMGRTDQAAALLAEAATGDVSSGTTSRVSNVAKDLVWGAIESHEVNIVRMSLGRIGWPRDDTRWHDILRNGFFPSCEGHRAAHMDGLRLTLDRADPNLRSKRGATLLHYIAAAHGDRTADDRIIYASLLLDAGARLDLRDDLLNSTPLGWACRWGRTELVRLFLERGADPIEPEAESWATPTSWAEKMHRSDVLDVLREHVARRAAHKG